MKDPMQRAPLGRRGPRSSSSRDGSHQDTPSLLSYLDTVDAQVAEGQRRRDDGIRAAELNTLPGVKAALERTIREMASTGQPFTAEDVRARCAPLGNPNALGAAINAAARRDEIVCVGYRQATRPEAHARILRVWRGAS